MVTQPLVLIADDDREVLRLMSQRLNQSKYRVAEAVNAREIYEHIFREEPILLLLDLQLGECDGLELMMQLLRQKPMLNIVIFTGHATIESAVSAMKAGAFDYLTKPVDPARLLQILHHALERQVLTKKVAKLEAVVASREPPPRLLGTSPAMQKLRHVIGRLAGIDATVLILGESGTGKELVARELHEQSLRRSEAFVAINMAALPQALVESTLFGHEKGSFTGADRLRIGSCEAADKGTLFLDEIGEMHLDAQAKLLRFLQQREVVRVGSEVAHRVDVRVVAATNRDLEEEVRAGRFREDLYYRLNVVPIQVPPIRERTLDVPQLVTYFLDRANQRYQRTITGLTESAMNAMEKYDWPGNVREIENIVERLAILCHGTEIDLEELPAKITATVPPAKKTTSRPDADPELRTIDELEKNAILASLRQARGNVREASLQLGLGQATVYRKIKRFNIDLSDFY